MPGQESPLVSTERVGSTCRTLSIAAVYVVVAGMFLARLLASIKSPEHLWVLRVGEFWTAVVLAPVSAALAAARIGVIAGFLLLFCYAFLNYLALQFFGGNITLGSVELILVVAPIMVVLQIPIWVIVRLVQRRIKTRSA